MKNDQRDRCARSHRRLDFGYTTRHNNKRQLFLSLECNEKLRGKNRKVNLKHQLMKVDNDTEMYVNINNYKKGGGISKRKRAAWFQLESTGYFFKQVVKKIPLVWRIHADQTSGFPSIQLSWHFDQNSETVIYMLWLMNSPLYQNSETVMYNLCIKQHIYIHRYTNLSNCHLHIGIHNSWFCICKFEQ